MNAKKADSEVNVVARNRRARHNYFIDSTIEAGIILEGTEVKSLRQGQASIEESYATDRDGELILLNSYIPEYRSASVTQHEPRRPRKLLLRKRELAKLVNAVSREGMTVVPLSVYFNKRGFAKVELGLAKGKHLHEKRNSIKERDWKRDQARLMRNK
jgi:SsrA-binding protein